MVRSHEKEWRGTDEAMGTMSRALLVASLFGSACSDSKGATPPDGTMLSPYLSIGDTLAHDEITDLGKLGAQVIEAAKGKDSEPGVADLVQGAGRIGAQDIATARSAFKKMSAGMITWLAAHPDQRTGHMLVHCTMTFDGKGGLWVQKEGEVMNPYEGSMMLHCGDKLEWSAKLPET
jgi:hypothetical protein